VVGPVKPFPPHCWYLLAVAAKLVTQRPERRMRIAWAFMMDRLCESIETSRDWRKENGLVKE